MLLKRISGGSLGVRLGVGLTGPLGGADEVVERLLGLGPEKKQKIG